MGLSLRQQIQDDREAMRDAAWVWLMEHRNDSLTDSPVRVELYARLLSSLLSHKGVMPSRLGLDEEAFATLLERYFPRISPRQFERKGSMLERIKRDEYDELYALFDSNRSPSALEHEEEGRWAAAVLSAGCMGGDHLWQDMGFWSRADLSAYINDHFAPLAEKNVKDMKWKRFFYKQLCAQEGIVTCRAPSCQVCADYNDCFGPE